MRKHIKVASPTTPRILWFSLKIPEVSDFTPIVSKCAVAAYLLHQRIQEKGPHKTEEEAKHQATTVESFSAKNRLAADKTTPTPTPTLSHF